MNHKLHIWLTLFTGGMWIPVYAGLGLTQAGKVAAAKAIVAVQEEVGKQKVK